MCSDHCLALVFLLLAAMAAAFILALLGGYVENVGEWIGLAAAAILILLLFIGLNKKGNS